MSDLIMSYKVIYLQTHLFATVLSMDGYWMLRQICLQFIQC